MRRVIRVVTAGAVLGAAVAWQAEAQVSFYTDESAFLADLGGVAACVQTEGFESDATWGDVRTTISGGTHAAPVVQAGEVAWTSRAPGGGVTTSSGAARTGSWGFYASPHGDPLNGINDGFIMTTTGLATAAGGWLRTNTPGAAIELVIDGGTVVNFNGANQLTSAHAFFGVIDPAGFSSVEVRETEAGGDEVLLVFADDFTFGFASCPWLIFADDFESGGLSAWSD